MFHYWDLWVGRRADPVVVIHQLIAVHVNSERKAGSVCMSVCVCVGCMLEQGITISPELDLISNQCVIVCVTQRDL